MPAVTKKPHTDEMVTVRLRVHRQNAQRVKAFARAIEAGDAETFSVAEVFPEYSAGTAPPSLRIYRHREALTQKDLAALTGISQHHISEMEHGKRAIGKERAKKLAEVLHVSDWRLLVN